MQVYLGIEETVGWPCSRDEERFTVLLWRLPGAVRRSTCTSIEGETGCDHRRQRRGQVDLSEIASLGSSATRRTASCLDGNADRQDRQRRCRGKLGIALVPEGRRLFPSLTVEENLLIGRWRHRPAGAVESRGRSTGLFPILQANAATQPSDDPVRRPAADGRRSAAALMSQSRVAAVRRDQPRAQRRSCIRDIYAAHSGDQGKRHQSSFIVEQDIAQALKVGRPRLLLAGGPRGARRGAPATLTAETKSSSAYFGVHDDGLASS